MPVSSQTGQQALSIQQAISAAQNAGFQGQGLINVVSIAMAESGLDPNAQNCNNPGGSCDRGILQFNSYWHPELSDSCAYDVNCAFQQAYRVSNSGTSFSSWTTFTSNAYSKFASQVQSALGNSQQQQQSPGASASTGSTGNPITDLFNSDQFHQMGLLAIGGVVILIGMVIAFRGGK
jgi:hypothetical protein